MKKVIIGAAVLVFFGWLHAQAPIQGGGGGGGGTGSSNVKATCAGTVTSCAVTITTLNVNDTSTLLTECWDSTGAQLAITSAPTSGSSPLTTITPNFTSTTGVTCKVNSNGGAGPSGPAGPVGNTGPAGPSGTAGATGATGPPGTGGGGGGGTLCIPASASGTAYTCTPSPAFTATVGATMYFKPDVSGTGGATTIAPNGLGPFPVKLASNGTNPTASSIAGGSTGNTYMLVFDGTNLNLFNLSSPTTVTVEQFGAVGDGVCTLGTSCTGTDDFAAITRARDFILAAGGGTVQFGSKVYLTSAPLQFNVNGGRFVGQGARIPNFPGTGTMIVSTSTSADVVDMTNSGAVCTSNSGAGGMNTLIKGMTIARLTVQVTGKSLNIDKACWPVVEDVWAGNSGSDFYLRGTGNVQIKRTHSFWTTNPGGAIGYELDSTSESQNYSTRLYNIFAGNASAAGSNTGISIHGNCVADLTVIDYESAGIANSIVINSTNHASGSFCNGDMQFTNLHTIDGSNFGFQVVNLYGTLNNNLMITNMTSLGNTTALSISNSSGVHCVDCIFMGPGNGVVIDGANSHDNAIIGGKCDSETNCVVLSSNASNNVISGMTCEGTAGNPTTTCYSVASGSSYNTFTANTVSGFVTNGYVFSSGANNNVYAGNACDPTNVSTCFTDSGTGNGAGILGTPLSATLTNGTGLPISTGVSGLGTGVGTWLGTPSGTNLASALTSSLPNTKGGTGGDSSAQTGYAKVASGTWSYAALSDTHTLGCAVGDPAGAALSTGILCYIVAPTACTIQSWDIMVDAGTATIDVLKIASGTSIPSASIAASALPAIASNTSIHSTTLTGWTTSVAQYDRIGFNYTTGTVPKYIYIGVNCDESK